METAVRLRLFRTWELPQYIRQLHSAVDEPYDSSIYRVNPCIDGSLDQLLSLQRNLVSADNGCFQLRTRKCLQSKECGGWETCE